MDIKKVYTLAESGTVESGRSFFLWNYFSRAQGRAILTQAGCGFLLMTQATLVVNINFGQSKSIIIIFAIELEFAKCVKFTAHKKFALYGNLRGQEESVAWRHFCKINFHNKAEKHKICKKYFTTKINRFIQYLILLQMYMYLIKRSPNISFL